MPSPRLAMHEDEYLHWVKLHATARWNLLISGLLSVRWSELGVDPSALDITGDNSYGYRPLLERIASRYGLKPDNVVTAQGASMGNFLLMAAVLEPGDRVLCESPAYEPIYRTAEFAGAEVDWFDRRYEDGYAVDPGRIAAALTRRTRLVVLTNLHNPSGVYLPEETLMEVGQAAARVGALVLVDEAYLEFVPKSRPAFLLGDNFVSTNSLTKVYGLSGLRCGWLLAAEDVARRCRRVTNVVNGEGVLLAEIASCVAFDRIAWLEDRSHRLLAANRPLVDRFIAKNSEWLDWVAPDAGTICFPRLKQGTGAALAEVAREKYDVALAAGDFFAAPRGSDTGECSRHVRISFGNDTAIVSGGLDRLSQALAELGGAAG